MLSNYMILGFNHDRELTLNRQAREAYLKMLDECDVILKNSLDISRNEQHPDLSNFFMFNSLQDANVTESLKANILPVKILTVHYFSQYKTPKSRNAGHDFYFMALMQLNKKVPHTMIYPETLSEKIADIFVRNELDFKDHKKFSRKFYTLSKDKEKLFDLLNSKPLNELVKYNNLEIEINDDRCLFRHSRKPVSKKEAMAICDLVKDVHRILH
jgi:hypothetical protein